MRLHAFTLHEMLEIETLLSGPSWLDCPAGHWDKAGCNIKQTEIDRNEKGGCGWDIRPLGSLSFLPSTILITYRDR